MLFFPHAQLACFDGVTYTWAEDRSDGRYRRRFERDILLAACVYNNQIRSPVCIPWLCFLPVPKSKDSRYLDLGNRVMARLLACPISNRIIPSWKFSRGNFVLTLSVVWSLGLFTFSSSRTGEFSTASLTWLPKIMRMEFRSAASYVQHSSLSAVLMGLGIWKRAYIINFAPVKREGLFNLLRTRLLSISCSKGCGRFDFP